MRFLVAKKFQALYPIDEAGEEVVRRLSKGEIVSVELRRPRNARFHAKLFAMLSIILANQDAYKSMDDLLDVCKLSIGHCRTVRTKHGDVKIPESISFAAMDDAEFQAFYDRAVAWVVSEVIPGLRRADLDAEVEAQLLGFGEVA